MSGNSRQGSASILKILLVHNWYASANPSGENTVVTAESMLLKEHGCEVIEYFRFSDEIRAEGLWGKIKGGLATPFNPFSFFDVTAVIKKVRPDVVHIHNFFPLISPAVIYAASSQNIPIVMTIHNYRIGCAGGLPFRAFKFCMDCLESRSAWPAIQYGCYRNSRIATLPLAAMISLHRFLKTWQRHVDRFIILNNFQGNIFSSTDLIPHDKLRYKPQFMSNPPEIISWEKRSKRIIFMGRLSREKGGHVLLEAFERWGSDAPELVIVGDGPDADSLKKRFSSLAIQWLGQLSPEKAVEELAQSRLLVFPSICFEGFPMVVREALACGVPILSTDLGPMEAIIQDYFGRHFKSGDPQDLLDKMQYLWESQDKLNEMAVHARAEFDEKYTAEKNFKILMDIYKEAISAHHGKNSTRDAVDLNNQAVRKYNP